MPTLSIPDQLTTSDVVERSTLSAPMTHARMDANLVALKNKINAVIDVISVPDTPFDDSTLEGNINSLDARIDVLEAANALDEAAYISILDKIYPVGSIYTTTSAFPPDETFLWDESTWVAYGKGRVLMGMGSIEPSQAGQPAQSVGDANGTYLHTLQETEMPNHDHVTTCTPKQSNMTNYQDAHLLPIWHDNTYGVRGQSGTSVNGVDQCTTNTSNWRDDHFGDGQSGAGKSDVGSLFPPRGGSQPHNNIQPYTSVYFWKRTV